jgi:1,4-dihydroxy-2-naphthoate octaprenyltransferase
MNPLKAIRISEWWEYKLSPLLAVAYATSLFSDVPLYLKTIYILTLLAAVAAGAIYVSLINDITDIAEDRIAGKYTYMMRIPGGRRWLLPFACVSFGLVVCWYALSDSLSVFWYLMALLSFSLYSFKPFRLKHRGIWGVFADAAGAHLFPSLFVVSAISAEAGSPWNWYWAGSVSVWSFCYGMRGILWHQFMDQKNDRLSGGNTFACRCSPVQARILEICIFSVELAALTMVLWVISLSIVYFSLVIYAGLVMIRFVRDNQSPIIFLQSKSGSRQIIMLDYYQVFLPFSLLIFIALSQPWGWCLLLGHLLLFPDGVKRVGMDVVVFR